ncbi:hypothetical protein [Niallia sp. 03133]|uniref:hypothetical protein n=1 Tax=Niallia sp. 03133 TaxID=3458060 RepID=UPI00404411FD
MRIKLNLLIISFAILISICFSFNLEQAKASENLKFVNKYGIEITESDYNRLISLGFEDEQIQNMNAEEYDINKEMYGETINVLKQYVKTTYLYDQTPPIDKSVKDKSVKSSKSMLVEENEPELVDEKVEYLSKEEFEQQLKYDTQNQLGKNKINNSIALSPDEGTDSTSYKIITVKLTKIASKEWKVSTTLEWKKVPATRSKDIISAAIRYPDDFVINHTKRYGSQYYESTGVNAKQQSKTYNELITYGANSGNWLNEGYEGDGLVQNLRNNFYDAGYNYKVTYFKNYMYFYFNLDVKSYSHSNVQVSGSYVHQINTSPFSVSDISLTYGAPSITIGKNDEEKFDTPIYARAYVPY